MAFGRLLLCAVLLLGVLFYVVHSLPQREDLGRSIDAVSSGCSNLQQSIPALLANPPANFDLSCVTNDVIVEFIDNLTYVQGVLNCMKNEQCNLSEGYYPGYDLLANLMFDYISGGGICKRNCDPKIREVVRFTLQTLSKKRPNELTEGLHILG